MKTLIFKLKNDLSGIMFIVVEVINIIALLLAFYCVYDCCENETLRYCLFGILILTSKLVWKLFRIRRNSAGVFNLLVKFLLLTGCTIDAYCNNIKDFINCFKNIDGEVPFFVFGTAILMAICIANSSIDFWLMKGSANSNNNKYIPAPVNKRFANSNPFIFTSYSHMDTKEVYDVIKKLQDNSFNVWYDDNIEGATEWDENIAHHIDDCECVIAYVSTNYINSKNCMDEIKYARDINKPILIIYLNEVELPSGVQMRLGRSQALFKFKYNSINIADFYNKIFQSNGVSRCKIKMKAETDYETQ